MSDSEALQMGGLSPPPIPPLCLDCNLPAPPDNTTGKKIRLIMSDLEALQVGGLRPSPAPTPRPFRLQTPRSTRKRFRGATSEENETNHVCFGNSANGGGLPPAFLDCKLPALLSREEMNKNVLSDTQVQPPPK